MQQLPRGEQQESRGHKLTRDFNQTVIERIEQGPDFAKALLNEAATLFLNGEPDVARLILRDLVHATVGFENLAELTQRPTKNLNRMLSPNGMPDMNTLAAIFKAIGDWLNVSFDCYVHSEVGSLRQSQTR